MMSERLARMTAARRAVVAVMTVAALATVHAAETALAAIEKALSAAQQDKRGVSLHVAGQVIAGAVVRIEPGQWVELRNAQFGRIVVRLERIDAVAMP